MSIIKEVSEVLRESSDINLVFGKSEEIKGKTIIPVSSVRYAFGGGSGKHGDDDEGKGAGGGLNNNAIGLFEITEERVCFKPVINLNHVLKIFTIWLIISFLKKIFLRKK